MIRPGGTLGEHNTQFIFHIPGEIYASKIQPHHQLGCRVQMQWIVLLYVNYLYHHHHHLPAHLAYLHRHIQSACAMIDLFSLRQNFAWSRVWQLCCGIVWYLVWCVATGTNTGGGLVNLVCSTFITVTREF